MLISLHGSRSAVTRRDIATSTPTERVKTLVFSTGGATRSHEAGIFIVGAPQERHLGKGGAIAPALLAALQ
jgi:hypothetical protein